jgi:hypothetical protein
MDIHTINKQQTKIMLERSCVLDLWASTFVMNVGIVLKVKNSH